MQQETHRLVCCGVYSWKAKHYCHLPRPQKCMIHDNYLIGLIMLINVLKSNYIEFFNFQAEKDHTPNFIMTRDYRTSLVG